MLKAVILDLDGTLVDSEQQGHRVAFNLAFEAFSLPDRWDPERYRQLLSVSGGERRLFGWLSSPDSSFRDRPEAERREMAGALHRWKTQRFAELAAAGEIPAQPGAVRLVEQLESAGVTLAIATTGSRQWVEPLVDRLFGWDRFATVVTGEDVRRLKPDPEAYLVTLRRLGLVPPEAVAIEDSGNGWNAARAAGVACLVVANAETSMDEVADADLVLDGLGADGHPPHAIVDGYGLWRDDWPDADVLARLLDASIRSSRQTGDR